MENHAAVVSLKNLFLFEYSFNAEPVASVNAVVLLVRHAIADFGIHGLKKMIDRIALKRLTASVYVL